MSDQRKNSPQQNNFAERQIARSVQAGNVNPYLVNNPAAHCYPAYSTAHPPPPQQIAKERAFGDHSAYHQTRNNYATSSSHSPFVPYAKGDGKIVDPWVGSPVLPKDETKK
jgi:hypothetical protein